MDDREFLMWIHERLEYVHDENSLMDYMRRLRGIIKTTQPEITSNTSETNDLEELKRQLGLK